jgi:hypothetical protein
VRMVLDAHVRAGFVLSVRQIIRHLNHPHELNADPLEDRVQLEHRVIQRARSERLACV